MKDDWGDGLSEDRGGFLGLLDGFAHVGRGTCCIMAPCRALVEAIILWSATCTGAIGGLA